jgi:hypothetical protein
MKDYPKADFSLSSLLHSHWDLCLECRKDSWFNDYPFLLPKVTA